MMQNLLVSIGEMLKGLWESSGLNAGTWQNYVMLLISFVLFYLAIVRKFEPLLLLPIAFGMFLINLPGLIISFGADTRKGWNTPMTTSFPNPADFCGISSTGWKTSSIRLSSSWASAR